MNSNLLEKLKKDYNQFNTDLKGLLHFSEWFEFGSKRHNQLISFVRILLCLLVISILYLHCHFIGAGVYRTLSNDTSKEEVNISIHNMISLPSIGLLVTIICVVVVVYPCCIYKKVSAVNEISEVTISPLTTSESD